MLQRWLRGLHRLEDALLAGMLIVLVLLSVAQIGLRVFLDTGWTWAEPASRTLVLWLAMLGALGATRDRRHIAIDGFPRLLPHTLRRAAWLLAQAFAALISIGLAWYSLKLVQLELEAPLPLFGPVPSWVGMLILPFGFALMGMRFALAAFALPPVLVGPDAPRIAGSAGEAD